MGENKGQEITSEATVIKLLRTALEKIEKEMPLEMGGQIGGYNPNDRVFHGRRGDGGSVNQTDL